VSRVGKLPIPIPSDVTVTIDQKTLTVKGPKGTLVRQIHPDISVDLTDGTIVVTRPSDARSHRALHGMTRAILANMVNGVHTGFRKTMEIVGVGYKVEARGKGIQFSLGYSHPIFLVPPPGITFEVEKPTLFHISGFDRELVGQIAAKARFLRPPDPYKGKGVKYIDEIIRRKAGKTSK
jgi:large subunit ribosomal protein L6